MATRFSGREPIENKDAREIRRDQRIKDLLALRPAESDQFVENQLSKGNHALLFKIIFRMLILMGRRMMREG